MIGKIFELGINVIESLMIVYFITRYLGCRYSGKRAAAGFAAASIAMFSFISIINYFYAYEGSIALFHILISFSYALIFLKGSFALKLWICTLAFAIELAIADFAILITCRLMGCSPQALLTEFSAVRVVSVIATKVAYFCIIKLILMNKYSNKLKGKSWIVIISVLAVSSASMTALVFTALRYNDTIGYMLCGIAGILIADFITYYHFKVLNKDYENRIRLKLLEQSNENAVKSFENSQAFVNQMKSVRHDMKNQLLMLSEFIKNKQYDRALVHITTLTEEYMPDIHTYINSENEAFNAIINAKTALCRQKNIYIEVKAMQNALANLNPVDTGVLFGNLLDNAIEAAQSTAGKRITVDVRKKGHYLLIMVTNSIDTSVLRINSDLHTTKSDTLLHGTGIKTVRALVERYDGMIEFFEENGEFCCHVMLYDDKGDNRTA